MCRQSAYYADSASTVTESKTRSISSNDRKYNCLVQAFCKLYRGFREQIAKHLTQLVRLEINNHSVRYMNIFKRQNIGSLYRGKARAWKLGN